MKQYYFSILIILFSLPSYSQGDSSKISTTQIDTTSFVFANVVYEKGDYTNALPIYEKIIEQKGPSAQIYFNIGNCYYKLNNIGRCVLNYERALNLNPGDDDIKYNLDLANLRIRDKLEPVNEMFLLVWWRGLIKIFQTNTWAYISIILLWLALISFIIFRDTKNYFAQRASFYVFIISFWVFVVTIVFAYSRNSYDAHNKFAIVMEPSAIIKSEPNESSTNLFLIHEGLKIRILNSESDWTEIKMADGNEGWILTASIEEI